MNKYQLATLSIAGKKLAKIICESWEDHKASPTPATLKGRKAYFEKLNSDSAMKRFGDATKFTAFIYSVASDTLYGQGGHRYHGDGLEGGELSKALEEKDTSRFLFGRFGESPPYGGFITIWGTAKSPSSEYYGLPLADENGARKMLMSMVKGTMKIVGHSPAKLPITPDYIYVDHDSERGPELVADKIRGMLTFSTQNKCDELAKIDVDGKEITLATALGNLHMVKGKELEAMKRAICRDKEKIKQELEKQGCKRQLWMLEEILDKISCVQPDLKFGIRQDLKNMLHPDNIDKFRTQKEIDAAWDRLHPREGTLNFGKWLKLRETKWLS